MAESVELAKAYVQIVPSAKGMGGGIQEAMGDEPERAGESAGFSIASKIKAAIIVAGIGKAISASVMEGAKLEQSIGGIETLFKDSADKMKEYANQAYETAGVSANEYMEQATSFSASLLQSLGGDTAKAADAANQAIIDMADNSNKMGTSLEDIQHAYQGFAKQNYTMLDNLKLGYGGTKQEMERLLADAEKLSGVKYDISNLNDVYNAIHVIQEDLDITGTTSKEAASTLTGSFNSMKSAATNFLGYLALGEDVKPALTALVKTTSTFLFDNLIPAIGNVIAALPDAIGTLLNEGIPLLLQKGTELIKSLSKGIASSIPDLVKNVMPMILSFTETLRENVGQLVDAGVELVLNLAQGIADSIPTLVEYIPGIVSNIAGIINDNVPKMLEAGMNVIITLVQGLLDAIPIILANLPQIIKAIWDAFTAINWLKLGATIITKLKDGIVSMTTSLKDMVVKLGKEAWEGFKNINWTELGKNTISFIINGLKSAGSWILDKLIYIGKSAWGGFKSIDWLDLGKNIVTGIIKGLALCGESILDFLLDLASEALDGVLSFFGIHSPSRVFRDQVGKMLVLGMADGIVDNIPAVEKAINELNNETLGMADTDLSNYSELDVTPAGTDSIIDYDRLISGLYDALSGVTLQSELNIDSKTLAVATAPLVNRELSKQTTKDRRNT